MDNFMEFLLVIWAAIQTKLVVLAVLMALDFILGVVVALVFKEFDWQKLDHYLLTDFLPILGWLVVVIITSIPAELIPGGFTIPVVADVVYGTVFVAILTSILQNLAKAGVLKNLFSKISIPYSGKPN